MPVQIKDEQKTTTGRDFAVSVVLHVLVIGGVMVASLIAARKSGTQWGDRTMEANSIQATVVTAIPLPPRQPVNQDNVLASETPSPAPVQEKTKAEPPPSPTDIQIQEKKKPEKTKVAEKPQKAVEHPQPTKVKPNVAQSGETSGIRVAMTTAQTNAGTSSMAFTSAGFGDRFSYYARQMVQKVSQQWYTGMLHNDRGRKVVLTFRVNRDGTPANIRITQPSGDTVLDQSAMRALQRIDTFGPLPDAYTGSYLEVNYAFEPNL